MGSVQSYLSTQSLVGAAVVAGALAYGYVQYTHPQSTPNTTSTSPSITSKKGKKKKAPAAQSDAVAIAPSSPELKPNVVNFQSALPGGFDTGSPNPESASSSKPKKKKKAKKAAGSAAGTPRAVPTDAQSDSSATAPESAVGASARPSSSSKARKGSASRGASAQPMEMDEQWTRVEVRRKNTPQRPQLDTAAPGPATSDAGITTSVTENSSPVIERTEDESQTGEENRRTLAEKLLPKPRKTGVDDMLETPDYPPMARVMRIQPLPDEKPAAGFSWGDYEDVEERAGTADDADGEDDGGWGVVKSRSRKPNRTGSVTQTASAPETMTKKQRQNAAKREAAKAAKQDGEAERLAALAQHKRELEKLRIAEQLGGKKTSGGMTASVDANGKLVWD